MNGVSFNGKHSYDDFGLLLQSRVDVGTPAVKANTVDIKGGDGVIDLSDALTGHVFFDNRKIVCNFIVIDAREKWSAIYSKLLNYFHGEKMKIIIDDDRLFYYLGRVGVNEWKSSKTAATIVVEIDAEPYKYDLQPSDGLWEWDIFDFENGIINELGNLEINGTDTITVIGRKKTFVPTITSNAEMTVKFKGKSYNIAIGNNKIFDIEIVEGENLLTFTGTGTITISYIGGEL